MNKQRKTATRACIIAQLFLCICTDGPTLKKEQLADSLKNILAQEGVNASVRLVKHTLAVQLDYPDSLQPTDSRLGFGPAFEEALRKGVISIHRVALSTDADIDFYVLLLSDPNNPGSYLTVVRYMDDVLRANANMLDSDEFISRSIFELNNLGPKRQLILEQYIQRDIELPEFLSWQLARRIQQRLTDEFAPSTEVEVGRCQGEFHNREFAFTLNVAPLEEGNLAEGEIQSAFQAATGVIAQVLSSYHFDSFDSVRLIHLPTGRNLVLPKATFSLQP
jgi:hypothetical protein